MSAPTKSCSLTSCRSTPSTSRRPPTRCIRRSSWVWRRSGAATRERARSCVPTTSRAGSPARCRISATWPRSRGCGRGNSFRAPLGTALSPRCSPPPRGRGCPWAERLETPRAQSARAPRHRHVAIEDDRDQARDGPSEQRVDQDRQHDRHLEYRLLIADRRQDVLERTQEDVGHVVDPVREARVWVGSQQLQHQPDQHQTLDNAEHQIDELDGAPARVEGADHLGFGWCLGTFAHHPLALVHLTARRIAFEFGVPTLHFVLPSAPVVKRRESGYAGNARGHSGTRAPGGSWRASDADQDGYHRGRSERASSPSMSELGALPPIWYCQAAT